MGATMTPEAPGSRVIQSNVEQLRSPTSESTRLRSLCGAALRRALLADASPAATMRGVRPILADACREAHARGLHAEQLLVMLKSAWFEVPKGGNLSRFESDGVLTRVVTLCIDEYYRTRD
jgi:hypothetical protein